jgi:hypothetical protein
MHKISTQHSKKIMAMAQRHAGFDDVSAEVLGAITELLPVDALLHLEQTSCHMRELLRETVAQRCKRECFTTYLYPTIATYRMLAPVPEVFFTMCVCVYVSM